MEISAIALQDMEDPGIIDQIAEAYYLAKQERWKKGKNAETMDKSWMTWQEYSLAHERAASGYRWLVKMVMSTLGDLGFELVKVGQWLPRKTLIVSEPFHSSSSIQTSNQGSSRRRR